MYYITNKDNQIIAISPDLLELLEVENMDELYTKIALGDIKFSSLPEEKITIVTGHIKETYDVCDNDLIGILGNITLVQIIQTSEKQDNTTPEKESKEAFLTIGTDEETKETEEAEIPTLDDKSDDMTLEDHLLLGSDEITALQDEVEEESETSDQETEETSLEEDEAIEERTEERPLDEITFKDEPLETEDLLDLDLTSIKDDDDTSDDLTLESDDIAALLAKMAEESPIEDITFEDEPLETEEMMDLDLTLESDDTTVRLDEIDKESETSDQETEETTPKEDEAIEEHTEESLLDEITFKDEPLESEEMIKLDLISIKDDDDISYDLTLESDDTTVLLDKIDEESPLDEITFKDAPSESEDMLDLISIKDDDDITVIQDEVAQKAETAEEEAEFFDLILPNAAEETIDEITIAESKSIVAEEEYDETPICLNAGNICKKIGISTEDYNIFLNEYIDTALSLEKDLQSTEGEKRAYAIDILSHLSNVLHLPVISEIVTKIENTSENDLDTHIKSFYAALSRLTTSPSQTEEEEIISITKTDSDIGLNIEIKKEIEPVDSIDIESMDLFKEEPVEEAIEETIEEPIEEALFIPETASDKATDEGFGTINLDDVKPIHFDFQLEEAANELSLPVELIEEFVHDFIEQSHVETQKMLEAYQKGDLDTIQKIGHLLKGTSSNLRINPLSDTLYEIQFCEDSEKLESFIRDYWGHFLSLETQIKLTSK